MFSPFPECDGVFGPEKLRKTRHQQPADFLQRNFYLGESIANSVPQNSVEGIGPFCHSRQLIGQGYAAGAGPGVNPSCQPWLTLSIMVDE